MSDVECERFLMGINLCLCWLKLLQYVQVTEKFTLLVLVLVSMMKKLGGFIMLFFVFVIAFAAFDYIAFGTKGDQIRTFWHSMMNSFYKSMGDVDPSTEEEYHNAYVEPFDLPNILLIIFLLVATHSCRPRWHA